MLYRYRVAWSLLASAAAAHAEPAAVLSPVVGGTVTYEGAQYFRGDESNQMKPLPGFAVLNLHSTFDVVEGFELFLNLENALNARYSTFGLLGDPTSIGAPGVPAGAGSNGLGVDSRFESPAPPISVFGG
jgi:iron complex outermembrane recepter protein